MVWIGVRAPEGIVLNVDTSKEVGDVGQLKESKYVVNVFRLFFKSRAQELWPGRTIRACTHNLERAVMSA